MILSQRRFGSSWNSAETGKPVARRQENQRLFLILVFGEGFISLSGEKTCPLAMFMNFSMDRFSRQLEFRNHSAISKQAGYFEITRSFRKKSEFRDKGVVPK
jgi:hypothetical protein